MKTLLFFITLLFASSQSVMAEMTIQIISIKGDVKVRYGLEEKWQPMAKGLILKNIDTILSGENGEVILKTADQRTFILGSNAILDIADLRDIQEKELFLYLMSKKVDNIEPHNNKTHLRVGSVSVIHGSLNKGADSTLVDSTQSRWAVREKNGALALLVQKYYTNSIIKLHQLMDKYGSWINKGEIYYYIGKGFEALNKTGQALDAYQASLDYYNSFSDSAAAGKKTLISERIEALRKK